MIYLLFLLFYFITITTEKKTSKGANLGRFLVAVLYTLLVGLRGIHIGKDTETYYQHFYLFGQFGCDFVEPGFDYINRFCYSQGWLPFSSMLICASISIIPICYYLFKLKHSEYIIASFLFYMSTFVILCNGMRQCIAVGLVFALLFYVHEHEFNKRTIIIYTIGVICASFFHISVLFLLPIILLKKVALSNKLCIIIYLISFLFVFVNFASYVPMLNIELGNRDYSNYFEDLKRTEKSILGFIVTSSLNIGIFTIMIKSSLFKNYTFISNLVLTYFILVNVGYHILMIPRFSLYFSCFVYFAIAHAITCKEYNKKTDALKLFVVCMYIVIIYKAFMSPSNMLMPYEFFWENNLVWVP